MHFPDLPIREALPRVQSALTAHTSAVLQAPPGAGKSTLVPLALLDSSWLAGRSLLMLEPRRIAARSVAQRMAQLLGERAGETVGYRTRLDTRVGPRTRIEVVTEGILTRMLQDDPALERIGLVLFDEFHERSLEADLGLALCLDAREHLRDDLRVLVMSATLTADDVAALLGNAPVVTSRGRTFPVAVHYRERSAVTRSAREDPLRAVATTIAAALDDDVGDLLVFLPGVGEIRRTTRLLEEAGTTRWAEVTALHGSLTAAEQDAVITPRATGTARRIVLSTNVAETSLTIPGIRVVVDSGLERRSVFDPATGMSRLVTARISRASADQRSGRAGRTDPGVCYRLWSRTAHDGLPATSPADILQADLAPLALELAAWGVTEPCALHWLDPPPAAPFAQARDLLYALGALEEGGRINDHGRRMARVGAHPRLAHMLIEAARSGHLRMASEIAALLSERDLLRGRTGEADVDLRTRLELLHAAGSTSAREADPAQRRRVLRSAALFERRVRPDVPATPGDSETPARLLASAYPDRIGQSRGGHGRYLLSGGRGALLAEPQLLGRSEYLVVADLDAGSREAIIRLAAPVSMATIEEVFAGQITSVQRIEWDDGEPGVAAYRERRLGAVLLDRTRIDDPDPCVVRQVLLDGLRRRGLDVLHWSREARALQARVEFLRRIDEQLAEEFPAFDDATLLVELELWLGPRVSGLRRLGDLARLDVYEALRSRLDWHQRQRLDLLAPAELTLPSGSPARIEYAGATPVLSARLQELFGLTETPRLAQGRVPLTIELLSPARRPVQLTQDLAGFWSRTYHEVRRELAGRYPRHHWPEDPLTATATARVKPRRR